MALKYFSSTWDKMRELVILSINVIYVKDLLQADDRLISKSNYLSIPTGSIEVHTKCLQDRKHSVQKRIKELLEDILNSKKKSDGDYCFTIDVEAASLTRKQLEKGYALFANIRDKTYALNLRNGCLLPIDFPELYTSDRNLMSLEYTAQHDGPIYDYFEIDQTDPLKEGDIRL